MNEDPTLFKRGDVVLCGRSPGAHRRVADVIAANVEPGSQREVVTVRSRGPSTESVWFADHLRPAPLRFWRASYAQETP